MKFLVLLSCCVLSTMAGYAPYAAYHGPPAPLAHDGRVIDTPEVAHAKAAHLAAYAAEAAKSAHHGYPALYSGVVYNAYHAPSHNAYHGPPAPLAHDGRVVDTPEVAHAKAAHLAAHAEQISKVAQLSYANPHPQALWIESTGQSHVLSGGAFQFTMIEYLVLLSAVFSAALGAPQWYGGHAHGAYGGHAAPAPLGPDGRVVDTPEVAQLKAAHLAALADANARAPKGPGAPGPYAGPDPSYAGGNYAAHYSGPPAPLGADGRVVDTPEVQQAKAVHFSLYNAEAQRVPAGPADPAASGAYDPSWNHGGAYNPSWNPGHNYY
ncbi:hypothetical protein KM043_012685 [Ampulex compressa]|nr:hypothetical protein KM043_012685 [Ampulex compressa]